LARPPVFVNARSGWFATYTGGLPFPIVDELYASHDGGLTWMAITVSAQVGALDFISDQVGWDLNRFGQGSSALLATRDGGRIWQALDPQLVT